MMLSKFSPIYLTCKPLFPYNNVVLIIVIWQIKCLDFHIYLFQKTAVFRKRRDDSYVQNKKILSVPGLLVTIVAIFSIATVFWCLRF